MYRYRDNSGGVTQISIKYAEKHILKLGKLLRIKGYRFQSTRLDGPKPLTLTHEAVLVVGEKGSARFEGFLWGYFGEGPHGLRELLRQCGVEDWLAHRITYGTPRGKDLGTDWELVISSEWRKKEAA